MKQYLPAGLSAEELASAIGEAIRELDASGMKDMGRVIGHLKQKYGTRWMEKRSVMLSGFA